MQRIGWISAIIAAAILSPAAIAQQRVGILLPAPNRANGEGFGPYRTFIVRGAIPLGQCPIAL